MIAHIPPWVFLILAVLAWAGWRQSRTRAVPVAAAAGIAIGLTALSVSGVVSAFGATALPLLGWAAGMAASLLLGERAFGPRGLARTDHPRRVQVGGSWLPMGLMMGIFAVKFALGMATGLGATFIGEPGFVAAISAVLGASSGAFAVRALAVWRFARAGQPVAAAA